MIRILLISFVLVCSSQQVCFGFGDGTVSNAALDGLRRTGAFEGPEEYAYHRVQLRQENTDDERLVAPNQRPPDTIARSCRDFLNPWTWFRARQTEELEETTEEALNTALRARFGENICAYREGALKELLVSTGMQMLPVFALPFLPEMAQQFVATVVIIDLPRQLTSLLTTTYRLYWNIGDHPTDRLARKYVEQKRYYPGQVCDVIEDKFLTSWQSPHGVLEVQQQLAAMLSLPVKPIPIRVENIIGDGVSSPVKELCGCYGPHVYNTLKTVLIRHYTNYNPNLGETANGQKGIVVLFYGPPGTGKTSLAKRLGELMGLKSVVVTTKEGVFGTPTAPGALLEGIVSDDGSGIEPSTNMCIVLDEVDKDGEAMKSDLTQALSPDGVIPSYYLPGNKLGLTKAGFKPVRFATSNERLEEIPLHIRSRCLTIPITTVDPWHKKKIIYDALRKEANNSFNVSENFEPWDTDFLDWCQAAKDNVLSERSLASYNLAEERLSGQESTEHEELWVEHTETWYPAEITPETLSDSDAGPAVRSTIDFPPALIDVVETISAIRDAGFRRPLEAVGTLVGEYRGHLLERKVR